MCVNLRNKGNIKKIYEIYMKYKGNIKQKKFGRKTHVRRERRMLPTPKKYFLTSGCAEGDSELTAFDRALLNAKIGNINLLKVSSILPPGVQYAPGMELPLGALVPTAYGAIISTEPGTMIAAAVAAGVSKDSFGVIMELVGKFTKEEAEAKIKEMVREAFEMRQMDVLEIKVSAVEHRVKNIGCALAAVPMWY
jgi:arginine decarboxylase